MEKFTLANAPPRPKPLRFENDDRRQTSLFAGMDCLAGQEELFPTDGTHEELAETSETVN